MTKRVGESPPQPSATPRWPWPPPAPIRVADLEHEADRVAAAHRQAQLIVALFRELSDAVRPAEG